MRRYLASEEGLGLTPSSLLSDSCITSKTWALGHVLWGLHSCTEGLPVNTVPPRPDCHGPSQDRQPGGGRCFRCMISINTFPDVHSLQLEHISDLFVGAWLGVTQPGAP